MAEQKMIIITDSRESIMQSIFRDTLTFGGFIGTSVALNSLIPPSGWLNAALGITWMLWLVGRGEARKMKMTASEARKWLDAEFPELKQ